MNFIKVESKMCNIWSFSEENHTIVPSINSLLSGDLSIKVTFFLLRLVEMRYTNTGGWGGLGVVCVDVMV